jgi:DNA-binding LacI/PurR family transcriptional regulator
MPKTVTQKEIAKRCGVCVMTVSCALRGDRSMVSEKTIGRIRKVAAQMGYREDTGHAARRLKYTHARENVPNQILGINLALATTASPYFSRLLSAISELLCAEDFALLSGWTSSTLSGRLPQVFRRGEVDGIFHVAGVKGGDQLLTLLRSEPGFRDRPIVSILEPLDDCPAVLIDDREAGRALGEYLLSKGHREALYMLRSFDSVPGKARIEGLRDAWKAQGLDPQASLHPFHSDFLDKIENGDLWRGFCRYRERHPSASVLLLGNDELAVRTWEILRGHGIRVPNDFSLTGFDDTHHIMGPTGDNILTTVQVPLEAAAKRAVGVMLALVRGEPIEENKIILPAKLIVRNSVADIKAAAMGGNP